MSPRRFFAIGTLGTLVLASTGCVATRNDVRILQNDIFNLRAQQARADSALVRQLMDLSTQMQQTLAMLSDSVDDVSGRLGRFQGDTRQALYGMEQQLLVVGELLGQSQQRLRELRAEMETRNQALMSAPIAPVTPGDTTVRATPPTGGIADPGPNQLYLLARDQLSRQSYATARQAFEELVAKHPNSDLAPDAQLGIAEAYAGEGMVPQADTANLVVVSRYPGSDAAPKALYRLGLSLARQGRMADARTTMQRVVRDYSRSEVADLAQDWLRANPGDRTERDDAPERAGRE
ncbi:MAG TPA: tetratricopeptide repeat protein [Gemmatimonadaceae bacterium]|nr:tetratricopeptide repeat protein [Gemmatimonadaceae bacterium]